MSSKKIYIFRDTELSAQDNENLQDQWLADNHPDKTIIGGEDNNSILVNEEEDTLICMEYIDFDE